jgi:hypothetical protein
MVFQVERIFLLAVFVFESQELPLEPSPRRPAPLSRHWRWSWLSRAAIPRPVSLAGAASFREDMDLESFKTTVGLFDRSRAHIVPAVMSESLAALSADPDIIRQLDQDSPADVVTLSDRFSTAEIFP